jgi:hypothetical protein
VSSGLELRETGGDHDLYFNVGNGDGIVAVHFVDARHFIRSSVDWCFQALSGNIKQHALLEAGSGRGSRLSSPKAHFSVARRGAEASTVGVYRAELHKRA